jgi:site-specific DNA recombinase
MRAAIYARYSSDNQREASIEDQVRLCRARIDREGWTLVETYADYAMSGATTLRSGYQSLLEGARNDKFDIVVAEALDRMTRDQEDIAALYKQLSFAGVRIITLSEGEISELHVGLKGTMNALFLKDLAAKTHRGLEGRVRNGKSGGGIVYGYDIVRAFDASGQPVRGDRRINEHQAAVVRRIYSDYISGRSPRAIAISLNTEGIVGPTGKGWTASTIIGNRKRGTGILNNELYIGKLVWNRLSYRRDPLTRKRVSQLNQPHKWITTEVSHLRIIEQEQWTQVQSLQTQRTRDTRPTDSAGPDWRQRRPKHLFSGLIKCPACGGSMSLISRVYYGCAASRNRGTCSNRHTIRVDRLEEAVLRGTQDSLLSPELTEAYVQEYTREFNRLKDEVSSARTASRRRLDLVNKQIANLVEAVSAGRSSTALLDRLQVLETERVALLAAQSDNLPDPIRLHPNIAQQYVARVGNLRACLDQDDMRDQAAAIMRTLVEEIRVHADDNGTQIELIGDLATLVGFANTPDTKKPGSKEDPGRTKRLVAGTGFEPVTFRL